MNSTLKTFFIGVLSILLLIPTQSSQATTTDTWSSEVRLSDAVVEGYGHDYVVSKNGNVAAAIWQKATGNFTIQARFAFISSSGYTWLDVQDLSDSTTSSYEPRIELSADGTKATAVWVTIIEGSKYVMQGRSATLTNGVAIWGDRYLLSGTSVQYATQPKLVLASDGTKATTIWTDKGSADPNLQVFAVTFDISGNTGTVGTPVTVANSTATGIPKTSFESTETNLAISADGLKGALTWRVKRGSQYVSRLSTVSVSSRTLSLGAAVDVSDPTKTANETVIDLSEDGSSGVVQWFEFSSMHDVLVSSLLISGTTPTLNTPTTLNTAPCFATASHSISVSSDGSKVLSNWQQVCIVDFINFIFTYSVVAQPISNNSGVLAVGNLVEVSNPGYEIGTVLSKISSDGLKSNLVWEASLTGASDYTVYHSSGTLNYSPTPTSTWTTQRQIRASGGTYNQVSMDSSSDANNLIAGWTNTTSEVFPVAVLKFPVTNIENFSSSSNSSPSPSVSIIDECPSTIKLIIYFKAGKTKLDDPNKKIVTELTNKIKLCGYKKVSINGYTSIDKPDNPRYFLYRKYISNLRANSVKSHIQNRLKVSETKLKISTKGLADAKPLRSNKTEKGRKLNRRVEVTLKN